MISQNVGVTHAATYRENPVSPSLRPQHHQDDCLVAVDGLMKAGIIKRQTPDDPFEVLKGMTLDRNQIDELYDIANVSKNIQ